MPPSKRITIKPALEDNGGPGPYKRNGKIAIVGCYPETWEKAPFSDASWSIWGFSRRNMGKLPRCDKWFELHDPQNFERYERDVTGYIEYLKNEPCVVLQKDFPKAELESTFGSFFFHSGQAPYLFAYAISLNPEAIGLWGIQALESHHEQKVDLQHFATICRDRGIELVVPEGCQVLVPRKTYL